MSRAKTKSYALTIAIAILALTYVAAPNAAAGNPCDGPRPPLRCSDPGMPPRPTGPAITSFDPGFGTAGDRVTFTGWGLAAASSVSFGSYAATFSASANGSSILATVPSSLTWQSFNGSQVPVNITVGSTHFQRTYSISPTITVAAEQDFPSHDGGYRAWTSVALARDNGFVTGSTIIDNDSMASLPVTVSVLFGDSSGKMIGYTPPFVVTAGPCLPIMCGSEPNNYGLAGTEMTGYFTSGANVLYPNPGLASQVHTITVVQVRNDPDLAGDLAAYFNLGMSIYSAAHALAMFL